MSRRDIMQFVEKTNNIVKCDSKRFNYWGIPKAGNTSMKYAILTLDNDPGTLREMQRYTRTGPIGKGRLFPKAWVHTACRYVDWDTALEDDYENISVIRSPMARFISVYKDIHRRGPLYFGLAGDLPVSVDELLDYIEGTPSEFLDIHLKPQIDYILGQDGVLVDRIFNLTNPKPLEAYLGVALPHLNTIDQSVHLSNKQIEKLQQIYKGDVELFKRYGWES